MTGPSELHVAAGHGDVDRVRGLLAEGADVNVLHPESGVTPLHVAAQGGSVPVARVLLDAGALLNLQAGTTGATPLLTAVWNRRPEIVALLLEQPGVNAEIPGWFGADATEVIGFGARSDDSGAQEENAQLHRLLDDHRRAREARVAAQPLLEALTGPDADADERARRVRRILTDGGDELDVDAVSPASCSGQDGHTALLVAARDGNDDAVSALLDAGADQTLTDAYMHAVPAHKAAFNGHAGVLSLLVKAPRFEEVADLQGPVNGYTPLHDATWHGHTDCVRILVDAGVRTDLAGYDGKVPVELAREFGYADCEQIIGDAP